MQTCHEPKPGTYRELTKIVYVPRTEYIFNTYRELVIFCDVRTTNSRVRNVLHIRCRRSSTVEVFKTYHTTVQTSVMVLDAESMHFCLDTFVFDNVLGDTWADASQMLCRGVVQYVNHKWLTAFRAREKALQDKAKALLTDQLLPMQLLMSMHLKFGWPIRFHGMNSVDIPVLVTNVTKHTGNSKVQEVGYLVLGFLLVSLQEEPSRDDNVVTSGYVLQLLTDMDMATVAVEAVRACMSSSISVTWTTSVLCDLMKNPANIKKIAVVGGMTTMLAAMTKHATDQQVALQTMCVIMEIFIVLDENVPEAFHAGDGMHSVVAVMRLHPQNATIQITGCAILAKYFKFAEEAHLILPISFLDTMVLDVLEHCLVIGVNTNPIQIQMAAFAIGKLCMNTTNRSEVIMTDIPRLLIKAMSVYNTHIQLQARGFFALWLMAHKNIIMQQHLKVYGALHVVDNILLLPGATLCSVKNALSLGKWMRSM